MKINFWDKKKVLITGGTGFIGSHLASRLDFLGADVKLFIHNRPPQDKEMWGFSGDLGCWIGHLSDYLNELKPDAVFHLAAQPIVGVAMENEFDTSEINIRGTYNLYHVLRSVSSVKSILHVSTDKVYGDVEFIEQESPLSGTKHPYNATKLCGDIIAQMYGSAYGLPITIVRNGNVYGPGDYHWDRLIPGTIQRIYKNEHPIMRGNGHPLRDYIYVSEVVDAYIKLAEMRWGIPSSRSVNLGSHRPYSVVDVVDKILSLMNRVDLVPVTEFLWNGELVNQHIDNSNAEKFMGWNPTIDLDEGLKRTIPWYIRYMESMKNE